MLTIHQETQLSNIKESLLKALLFWLRSKSKTLGLPGVRGHFLIDHTRSIMFLNIPSGNQGLVLRIVKINPLLISTCLFKHLKANI